MVFKKENWFYFLLGSVVTFLVSIYWIWVYDNGLYPGFVFLQSAMGIVSVVLLIIALILKFAVPEMSEGKSYPARTYIGSKDTKLYHKSGCVAVKKMSASNRETGTIGKFKKKKYKPCDLCMVK